MTHDNELDFWDFFQLVDCSDEWDIGLQEDDLTTTPDATPTESERERDGEGPEFDDETPEPNEPQLDLEEAVQRINEALDQAFDGDAENVNIPSCGNPELT